MDRDRVTELQRWEESGAMWRVINRGVNELTVALLRCDAGEEVERFTSSNAQLLAFVGNRNGSED